PHVSGGEYGGGRVYSVVRELNAAVGTALRNRVIAERVRAAVERTVKLEGEELAVIDGHIFAREPVVRGVRRPRQRPVAGDVKLDRFTVLASGDRVREGSLVAGEYTVTNRDPPTTGEVKD